MSLLMSPSTDAEREAMAKIPYPEAVGALQWLVSSGRPDIAYAVSSVSRYLGCFGQEHWDAVVRIFRYLQQTREMPMRFKKSKGGMTFEVFADSDWAGDVDHRRSQGGFICFVGGNLITCKSILQRIVALSSTEAEYIAACEATKEAVWMRRVLTDIGFPQSQPTTIWEDNRSAICLSENPHDHARTKHIDLRYHYLRQQVQLKTVILRSIGTKDQVADILTKNSDSVTFIRHRNRMLNFNQ